MKLYLFVSIIAIIWWYGISQKYFDSADQAIHNVVYLQLGSLSSGDYDNDVKLDIVGGGSSVSPAPTFILYHHNISMQFFDVTNGVTFPGGVPPGFFIGRVNFVDVNADGLLDIFYSGCNIYGIFSGITNLYVQLNSSIFFLSNNDYFPSGLPPTFYSFFDFGISDGERLGLILIGASIPFTI